MLFGGVIWISFLIGQSAAALPDPEQIKSILITGSETQRSELAKELHLFIPGLGPGDIKNENLCTLFDSVDINYVKLLVPGSQAALNLVAPTWCEYTFLVILRETQPGKWDIIQTVPLWSKYNPPKITFVSLIDPSEKEIIVQDLLTDSGTGILQKNITILKLFADGLKVVFDEPTSVTFAIPIKGKKNSDQEESNEFSFVKDPDVKNGSNQILQKQMIRDHETRITRWWLYIWAAEIEKFRKVPTTR